MKLAVFLALSFAAYTADAGTPYIYPNTTAVLLKCKEATFDPAGAAASGSPTSKAACIKNCQDADLNFGGAWIDPAGHGIGLTNDSMAGCSFPAEYHIDEKATFLCDYTSTAKGVSGFFMAANNNVMTRKEGITSAYFIPKMTTVDEVTTTWQIYKASSSSCQGTPTDDWIVGSPVSVSVSGDVANLGANITEFYQTNDAENGKMYMFAVPGSGSTVDESSTEHAVSTVANGPMQFGVTAACGANTDCSSCVKSCHWCQLTVGDANNGLCGVTEAQCYGQQSPYGSVDFYLDQCDTPESTSTTTTTTTTTSNTGTTAASTITAGASSVMMLSVAGAVLLGAALVL